MNKFSFIAAAILLASLTGCEVTEQPAAEPPLAGATIGGPFSLVDQDGEPFTDKDLLGQYSIVYFGYSYCPDVCPVDLQRLMQGYHAFAKGDPAAAANVQPVFITVDPARDTPEVLGNFVASFGKELIGLTGTEEQVAQAAKAYLITYMKREGSVPDAYLMGHTQIAYLMGPDGKPVAMLPVDDPSTEVDEGTPQLVAAELARWVRPTA